MQTNQHHRYVYMLICCHEHNIEKNSNYLTHELVVVANAARIFEDHKLEVKACALLQGHLI